MADSIRVDYLNNADLKASLGQWKPGDDFEFTVRGKVQQTTAEFFEGTLTAIEVAGETEDVIEPDGEKPASVTMMAGRPQANLKMPMGTEVMPMD